MKAGRSKATVPPALRDRLAARSGGWCEARLTGCTGRATDVAHRIARQAGGRPLGDDARLSNVTHQCRACHRWCTDNPTAAYALGLALRDWQKPAEERVSYRGEYWALLGDDGSVVGFP